MLSWIKTHKSELMISVILGALLSAISFIFIERMRLLEKEYDLKVSEVGLNVEKNFEALSEKLNSKINTIITNRLTDIDRTKAEMIKRVTSSAEEVGKARSVANLAREEADKAKEDAIKAKKALDDILRRLGSTPNQPITIETLASVIEPSIMHNIEGQLSTISSRLEGHKKDYKNKLSKLEWSGACIIATKWGECPAGFNKWGNFYACFPAGMSIGSDAAGGIKCGGSYDDRHVTLCCR